MEEGERRMRSSEFAGLEDEGVKAGVNLLDGVVLCSWQSGPLVNSGEQ